MSALTLLVRSRPVSLKTILVILQQSLTTLVTTLVTLPVWVLTCSNLSWVPSSVPWFWVRRGLHLSKQPVLRKELCKDEQSCRRLYRQAQKLLVREESRLDASARARLAGILEQSQVLATVHSYRNRLQEVWERTATSQDALLAALQDWCKQAEATGIQALEEFSRSLRGYLPAPPQPV